VPVAITGAPGYPRNLVITQSGPGGTTANLSWSPPSNGTVTAYVIDAGTSSGAVNVGTFPVGPVTSLQAQVACGIYFVRIRATNALGSSGASNEVSMNVCNVVATPGAPTNLSSTVAGSTVSLAWAAPTTGGPPSGYLVEAGFSPGTTAVTLPLGNQTSLSVPGVAQGVYYVRVKATNVSNGVTQTSPASNEIQVVVGNPVLPPGAPGGLTATVGAGRSVTLTWTAPSSGGSPTGYVIQAGSASGLSNLAQLAIGNTTTFTANGVPPGTYFVRVRGSNQAGQGLASNEVTVVVP
jgi:predicted phage tail protein